MSQERARLAGGRTIGALAWSNSQAWNIRRHDGRQPISNYAFNPIAEQALRSDQTVVPQRVNAALAIMNTDRWELINALDEELLKGGVILSEWCSVIVREADLAFAGGANLASILTAVSGIETYLRSEYAKTGKERLVELISTAPIPTDLKEDLQLLRKYRNRWVHVDESWNDRALLDKPEETEAELQEFALFAVRALRRVIYENQCV